MVPAKITKCLLKSLHFGGLRILIIFCNFTEGSIWCLTPSNTILGDKE